MANKTKKEKLLDDLGIKNSDNVEFMTEEELNDTKVVEDLSKLKEEKLSMFSDEQLVFGHLNDKYEVVTFSGRGIEGLNKQLSLFKGQIVSVISFSDNFGEYVLQTLCLV